MRLASGVAPVSRYIDAGVPVGLGVDGSASNDSSNMLAEVRHALLLNRVAVSPGIGDGAMMTARQALELATVDGARILGRDDIGRIAPGLVADLIALDLNRIEFAGGLHDPVAAIVLCGPSSVDQSWVGGRPLVQDRSVFGVELGSLVDEHNRLSRTLIG
jgi:cytosine/adenosine deaminase-related metal-dependent hydrolase